MDKKIIAFLKLNGFEKMETNSYANDLCNVVFEDSFLTVADNHGEQRATAKENIYWLIGVLTWHSFINKIYKK